jgi:hypothetical protein
MTTDTAPDADLIDLAAETIWKGRESAMQRDYGGAITAISWAKAGDDNQATYRGIAKAVLAAVQPEIERRAKREVLLTLKEEFLSGAVGLYPPNAATDRAFERGREWALAQVDIELAALDEAGGRDA